MKKAPKKPIPPALLDDDDDDFPVLKPKKAALPAALLDDDDEDWRPTNAREEKNVTPPPEPAKPTAKMTPERPSVSLVKLLPPPPANFGNIQTDSGDRVTITSVISKDGKDVLCWHHRMACSMHLNASNLLPREDVALVIAYVRLMHGNA